MLKVHSTRLFPWGSGADRYEITGIAARCDWVLLSDNQPPEIHLVKQGSPSSPSTIFLSMRNYRKALEFFANDILPELTHSIILISGSEDVTLPNQIDTRMPPMRHRDRQTFDHIMNDPRIKTWYAENLDCRDHKKLRPIPLGLVHADPPVIREDIRVPEVPRLSSRPISVLCAHRVREGSQWTARRNVTELARTSWSEFCEIQSTLPEPDFLRSLTHHSFVLCVEGGGLDPSPKAWQALLHGAIPIVRRTALFDAYKRLPIMFVDQWHASEISTEILVAWKNALVPHFDDPMGRKYLLHKLSIDYWWQLMIEGEL